MNTGNRNYELLLEHAPDATIMINPEGLIRYVNLQTERLFLYNRTELIDQPIECLIPARYRAVHLTHRESYAKAPRQRMMGIHISHLAGLCKDGREFPAEISLAPLPDGYVLAGIRERQIKPQPKPRLSLNWVLILILTQALGDLVLYFVLR